MATIAIRVSGCGVPAPGYITRLGGSRRPDEQRGGAPRRRQACGEPHRKTLQRCPADPARDLALRHDELLPKQCVLSHETGVTAHDVGG